MHLYLVSVHVCTSTHPRHDQHDMANQVVHFVVTVHCAVTDLP